MPWKTRKRAKATNKIKPTKAATTQPSQEAKEKEDERDLNTTTSTTKKVKTTTTVTTQTTKKGDKKAAKTCNNVKENKAVETATKTNNKIITSTCISTASDDLQSDVGDDKISEEDDHEMMQMDEGSDEGQDFEVPSLTLDLSECSDDPVVHRDGSDDCDDDEVLIDDLITAE